MNTLCSTSTPASYATTGVTESLRKPRYHIHRTPDAYEVHIDLPGVPKSGVKIDLEDSILTVRGERVSHLPEGTKAHHRELSPLSYLLRLRLNTPVNEEKLSAQLADGVLILSLPLKEAAKPRHIPVQ